MAIQSSYSETMTRTREGHIVRTGAGSLTSRIADEDITFGKPLFQGTTDDRSVRLTHAGASAANFVGISVRDRSTENDMFEATASVRVCRADSVISVVADVAVAAGDPVHVNAGVFTNTGGFAIAGARWETSAAAGELADLYLS